MQETLLVLEWKPEDKQPLSRSSVAHVKIVYQDESLRCGSDNSSRIMDAISDAHVAIRSYNYPEWCSEDLMLYIRGTEQNNDNKMMRINLCDLQQIAVSLARLNGRKNVVDPLKSGPGRLL
jgi:hypothetical protein